MGFSDPGSIQPFATATAAEGLESALGGGIFQLSPEKNRMPSSRSLRAGKAVIELGMPSAAVEKALKRIQARAKAIGASFQRVGRMGLVAGGAIVGAFAAATREFTKTGDTLNKMSLRTGVSAQALSEIGFAAEQSGASLTSVEKGIRGMARNILDAERGLSTATDNFDDLGLSLDDIAGKSPDKQFELIAQKTSEIEVLQEF